MGNFSNLRSFTFTISVALLGLSCASEKSSDASKSADQAPSTQPIKEIDHTTGDKSDGSDLGSKDKDLPEGDEEKSKLAQGPCVLPKGFVFSEYTMESMTALFNAMPKPIDIPCVLDVLPRPLKINATSSDLSVQPAQGESSPRVFLKLENLILTFALSGDGAQMIEFSLLLSDLRSVKGELAFPLTEKLGVTTIYDHILKAEGGGTRCVGCHFDETPAGGKFPATAFSSKALRPFTRQDVSLDILKQLKGLCTDTTDLKCRLLESIYRGQDPQSFDFPEAMPTLF